MLMGSGGSDGKEKKSRSAFGGQDEDGSQGVMVSTCLVFIY